MPPSNKIGFIGIIASILVTLFGLLYQNRIVIIAGGVIFSFTILFLAVFPIIFLHKNKDRFKEKDILLISCPSCGNKIPSDIKKCHICGKKFDY